MNFLYRKLFDDTVSEINSTLKPRVRRPYLQVKLQSLVSVRGLFDIGADISCLSQNVFHQIPPEQCPIKISGGIMPKFKSAGGRILPVDGKYQFRVQIGTKTIQHEFYVIPDLNEPIILGIDFIQQHQLWYCPKNRSFAWEGQPNWGTRHLKVCSAKLFPHCQLPLSKFHFGLKVGHCQVRVTCASPTSPVPNIRLSPEVPTWYRQIPWAKLP
jgi:hypothetical protein